MGEDLQAAERRRRGLPNGIDPRNYDPRRALDPAARERMIRAQAAARAQAQAASTVVLATIISLVTAAFSFIAALAWNDAINKVIDDSLSSSLQGLHLSAGAVLILKATVVTIIAVIVVVVLQRVATRFAKKSAIDAVQAEEMM
jgi:hypothetical protein